MDFGKRLAKIGSSMLIVLAFVLLIPTVFKGGGGVTGYELVGGLAVMVVVLRLNIWRLDRKYEKDAGPTLE